MDATGPNEAPKDGLLAPIRRLTAALLSTIQNRIELVGVELQEQKVWLIHTVLWMAAAVFFGACAITVITITVIWLFPAAARPYVLIVVCLVYIGLAAAAFRGLRRQLLEKPPVLHGTAAELKKDVEWLRPPQ